MANFCECESLQCGHEDLTTIFDEGPIGCVKKPVGTFVVAGFKQSLCKRCLAAARRYDPTTVEVQVGA